MRGSTRNSRWARPLALSALASFLGVARAGMSRLQRLRGQSRHPPIFGTGEGDPSQEPLPVFYHTSDGLHSELQVLSKRCEGMAFETVTHGDLIMGSMSIDVVTIRASDAKPVNKVFMLFGEHARELISPETGLHFVKSLCGETSFAAKSKEVLKDSEFQIIVNANPASRAKVEQGHYCLRVNQNGVDLNRNWDEHWDPKPNENAPQDTNPGPSPFSELETQIFKRLVTAYNPTTFLTIHSGTRGLYMPWAWSTGAPAERNQKQMLAILKTLDKKYCECPYGAAGKEVGYACPGTCLDWIYDDLKTPYAFAFEIYAHPQHNATLKSRWRDKIKQGDAFYQEPIHLGDTIFRDVFVENPSSFVQLRENEWREEHLAAAADQSHCFPLFNPETQSTYEETLGNWVGAYLDMASLVVSDIKRGVVDNSSADLSSTLFVGSSTESPMVEMKRRAAMAANNSTILGLPFEGLE